MTTDRFAELAPWYVNGSLSAADRSWVDTYLAEHPEARAELAWFQSLLLFRPQVPNEIAASNVAWSLGTHMLFVDLFLMYFPFSKMVHAIGTFSLNLVRSE